MIKECSLCHSVEYVQYSHDIPKYIGGKDSDGIRLLCRIHHQEYDKFLLQKFLCYTNDFPYLDDWNDVVIWQKEIKKNKSLHPVFIKITKDILKYYFETHPNKHKYNLEFCPSCKIELDPEDFIEKICPKCSEYIGDFRDD